MRRIILAALVLVASAGLAWAQLAPGSSSSVAAITSGTISGISSLGVSGPATVTSNSANALAVGPNGATNPAFNVDASTASSATGITVKSAATTGTTTLTCNDSGVNGNCSLLAKGAGTATVGAAGQGAFAVALNGSNVFATGNGGSTATFTPGIRSSAGPHLVYTSPADTPTAGSEINQVLFNFGGSTINFATGAVTNVRSMRLQPATYTATGASTFTKVSTFAVDGAPNCSTNVTCTNSYAADIEGAFLAAGAVTLSGLTASSTGNYVCDNAGVIGDGTGVCSLSSIRWKTDVAPMPDGALAKVMAMRPVDFRYKPEYGDKGKYEHSGFIAEEAIQQVPVDVTIGEDGQPSGFNYPEYTAYLTKAIQEQQSQIDFMRVWLLVLSGVVLTLGFVALRRR